MELPKRKPNRLSYYHYSTPGAYFITICTKEKKNILGRIVGGGAFDAPRLYPTEAGIVAERYILSGNRIPGITVDKYVVMPNHIHMILIVEGGTSRAPSPTGAEEGRIPSPTNEAIPHFVSTYKRFCSKDLGENIFQRSYHDHVIRNEQDYLRIWQYIDTNPAKWQEDCFYISDDNEDGVVV